MNNHSNIQHPGAWYMHPSNQVDELIYFLRINKLIQIMPNMQIRFPDCFVRNLSSTNDVTHSQNDILSIYAQILSVDKTRAQCPQLKPQFEWKFRMALHQNLLNLCLNFLLLYKALSSNPLPPDVDLKALNDDVLKRMLYHGVKDFLGLYNKNNLGSHKHMLLFSMTTWTVISASTYVPLKTRIAIKEELEAFILHHRAILVNVAIFEGYGLSNISSYIHELCVYTEAKKMLKRDSDTNGQVFKEFLDSLAPSYGDWVFTAAYTLEEEQRLGSEPLWILYSHARYYWNNMQLVYGFTCRHFLSSGSGLTLHHRTLRLIELLEVDSYWDTFSQVARQGWAESICFDAVTAMVVWVLYTLPRHHPVGPEITDIVTEPTQKRYSSKNEEYVDLGTIEAIVRSRFYELEAHGFSIESPLKLLLITMATMISSRNINHSCRKS